MLYYNRLNRLFIFYANNWYIQIMRLHIFIIIYFSIIFMTSQCVIHLTITLIYMCWSCDMYVLIMCLAHVMIIWLYVFHMINTCQSHDKYVQITWWHVCKSEVSSVQYGVWCTPSSDVKMIYGWIYLLLCDKVNVFHCNP